MTLTELNLLAFHFFFIHFGHIFLTKYLVLSNFVPIIERKIYCNFELRQIPATNHLVLVISTLRLSRLLLQESKFYRKMLSTFLVWNLITSGWKTERNFFAIRKLFQKFKGQFKAPIFWVVYNFSKWAK